MGILHQASSVRLSLALFLLVLLSAHTLLAGDGVTPYVGIYGGVAIPETLDSVKGRGDATGFTFSDLKLNTGPLVGLKLGLSGSSKDAVARWFGLELDGSYMQTKLKEQNVRVSFANLSANFPLDSTKVKFITGAVHLLLKYPDGPFQPYVGAGPAVIHARISESNLFDSGNSTTIGLSAVGGFRLQFSEHIGAFFEYKHIRTTVEFDDVEGSAVVHAGVGGINFMF